MDSYKIPLIFAISLHLVLCIFLIHKRSEQGQLQSTSLEQMETIKAISIDQAQVEAEIANIQAKKLQQQQAEQARRDALDQQLASVREQRTQEEARLKALQAQRQASQKNQLSQEQAAQQRLTALASQQQIEQQQVEKLQQAHQQQQVQVEKLQHQAQQEQDELEKLQAQREQLAAQLKAQQQALEQRHLQEQQQRAQTIQTQVDRYKNLIVHAISRNWIIPTHVDKNLSCQFEIKLARDGSVKTVELIRSSGDPILDRSAENAIYRSSPLPVPSDADAYAALQVLNLTVRPEEVIS